MAKNHIVSVIVLSISAFPTFAQVAGVDAAACNTKFAESLVEQQVSESKSVVEPVKRIKILIRSAEFLWKLDQPTARAYYTEAWKMADDRFKQVGFEEKKSTDTRLLENLPDQRMEVIRSIAKNDPEWARKLSDQMLADLEKSKGDKNPMEPDREVSELLNLAAASAKTNPEFSRQIFRRVMKYPMTNAWVFAFPRMAEVDKAFTDAIYSEALRNFRNESPRRLLYLSAYPFALERIFGYEKYNFGFSRDAAMQSTPALERQFLETFFARIAAFAASEEEMNRVPEKYAQPEAVYMTAALKDIEPMVLQRHPDMLQRLGVARSQAVSLLNESSRKAIEEKDKQNESNAASFDENLAALKKAESEGKMTDWMIVKLVTWNKKTEEQFAELEPFLDKVKEEKARRELINFFWFLRAQLAVKENRFDDAEKYALKVPEIEHRALIMFDMANIQAKSEQDVAALFETLNRLSKLARTADNSVSKAQILLGTANMYEKVNHSVALDELSESIRVTNTLKDPDIFSTYVVRQIVGKDFAHFASFSTPGYNLEKTFEDLSKKDFEMSITHAKSLDNKYFRTLAVIAVAKNCAKNAPVKPKK